MIILRFFASLREQLGLERETMDMTAGLTVGQVVAVLQVRGEQWQQAFGSQTVLVAVNQELVDHDSPLSDGDELAFFPPVTGG